MAVLATGDRCRATASPAICWANSARRRCRNSVRRRRPCRSLCPLAEAGRTSHRLLLGCRQMDSRRDAEHGLYPLMRAIALNRRVFAFTSPETIRRLARALITAGYGESVSGCRSPATCCCR